MDPSMFGPAMFGMDPFGGFSTSLMGQVLMNFLQGPAPFACHCPCHQSTGLHQPHYNMPYGPKPEEAMDDQRDLPSPPPRPQLAQPRTQQPVRPQAQPAKPQAKPHPPGKPEAKPVSPTKTGQPQAKPGQADAKPGQSQVQSKPVQTQGQTAAKPGQPEAKAQTQAKPGPAKPQFDASKTASSLHKAMHGGLFGAGTDEDAIFKALEGRSPDEIKQVRAHYKEHYKRDLDADFKSEMSGKDLSRTQSLMKGDSAAANATALRQAMGGLGTDEKAVFSTLEGKSAKEREQIAAEYKKQTGRTLQADLKGDMSGSDLDRANALLKGDTAKSDAAKLRGAMAGLGTDEASIMKTLEGKSAKEREAIVDSYKKMYGTDLSKALKSELSGSQLTEAKALLAGDTVKADAAKLRTAMAGLGTDEDAINAVFAGKSAEERAKIQQEYKNTFGTDLHKALGKELSGNDLAKTKILMEHGKLSDAQELKFAMEGLGTDEEAVRRTLEGKSKEEIAKIKDDYRKETGRELTADLKSDMTGRDLFDATQALKGKPTTLEESVERLNERHQYERGGESNSFGRGVVDLFSDHGERLDSNVAASNESLQRVRDLEAQGRTQEAAAERARLERLVGYSNADVDSVREAKDSAADVAGTVAATAAGVVVIAVTAGTATPLVAAGMAAATGGSARVLVSGAIQGEAYGLEQGFSDFGRGAIDGGTAIIGAGSGRVATTAATETAEAVARNRILSTGVRQGIRDGAVEGTIGGAAQSLIDERTWDGDFASGITNVLSQTAIGTVTGGVTGGGTAQVMESGSAAIRGIRENLGGGGGRTANEFGADLREQGWQIKSDDRNATMVGDIHGREVMFEVTDPRTGQVSTRRGIVDAQDLEGNSSMFHLRGQEGEFNNNFIDNMAVRPRPSSTPEPHPVRQLEEPALAPEPGPTRNIEEPLSVTGTRAEGLQGGRGLTDGPTDAQILQMVENFPDSGLRQRFVNQENFGSLNPIDQLEVLRMADRHPPAQGFFDKLVNGRRPSSVEENLQRLIREGKMQAVGRDGESLLQNLQKLEGQRMYPGLDGDKIFVDALDTVANPGRISQGNRGTCSATSVQYIHARRDPSDYIRVMAELTGEKGQATLRGGGTMVLNRSALASDGSGRRVSDRLYQDSAMNHASADNLFYDNKAGSWLSSKGGHVDANGKIQYSGLYDTDAQKLMNDAFGENYTSHRFQGTDSDQARELFRQRLQGQVESGEPLHLSMKWGKELFGSKHSYHALVAEGMDDKFVYLRNPWGKSENASVLTGPRRKLVDKEGGVKIDHETFFANLDSYRHTPVSGPDRAVSRLQDLVRDADIGLGKEWREPSFYEGKLRGVFTDFNFDRIPPGAREGFYRELLQKADVVSYGQADLAQLGELQGIFQKYGVDDYDPLAILSHRPS